MQIALRLYDVQFARVLLFVYFFYHIYLHYDQVLKPHHLSDSLDFTVLHLFLEFSRTWLLIRVGTRGLLSSDLSLEHGSCLLPARLRLIRSPLHFVCTSTL
jgi:hypothetical protein